MSQSADVVASTPPPAAAGAQANDARAHRSAMRRKHRREQLLVTVAQVTIVVVALLVWELGVRAGWFSAFLVGSPSIIWELFIDGFASKIVPGIRVTLSETLLGFAIGNVIGVSLGLLLWFSGLLQRILNPFVVAFGAVPVLALAPLMVVWFGTGFESKVILATLSCVLVALIQAQRGANDVDPDLVRLMQSFGAGRRRIFSKIVVPSAMSAVVGALKLNIGFALIGAVIGEFISSDSGLGHMILVASSNFDLPSVIMGVMLLSILAIAMSLVVGAIEHYLLRWSTPGTRTGGR